MINSLEEFYKKIQNPILDEDNFDMLIDAYSNHNFLDTNYDGNINNIYSKGSNFCTPKYVEMLYTKIFNYWKKYLTTKDIPNVSSLFSLQQHLKNVKDVKTWKDAVYAFPIEHRTKYVDKFFDLSKDHQIINSVEIHEQSENTKSTPFDIEHILYVNVDLEYLHKFAVDFLDKCEKKKLPYLFDIQTHLRKDKSIAISSDSEHLLQYYQILQEIITEDKDLAKHIYHPPIFTGSIDQWIGYESFEQAKFRDREKITHHILSKGFKKMVAAHPNLPITKDQEDIALIDLVSSNVVDKEVLYLSNLSRVQLKDYFGLKPRDLKNKEFLKSMYNEVKKELETGIQNNAFKFNDVNVYFRKRNKKFFSIPHKDLEQTLSATLKNITTKYPNIKKKLQSTILNLADQKGIDIDKFCMKKKHTSLFKKLFNTTKENKKLATEKKGSFPPFTEPTETKTINNKDEKVESFIYRLRKEQIIQDLPINSKEESRYSGLMSEQEIKESQEKIKTFIKK